MNLIPSVNIIQSFLGSLLALLFAGLVWFIKSAYEKHKRTSLAIAKFERGYVENIAHLDQYIALIRIWIQAIENKQKYAAPPFSILSIDNESHLYLGDMRLVNLLIKTNFKQKGLNDDISSMHSFYEKNFSYFLDKKISMEQWHSSNEELLPTLKKMTKEIPEIQSSLIQQVAYLRLSGRALFHSIFNYIQVLNVNIWPRVTNKKINQETMAIKKEREFELK
ncbi:MAG: hypothetical protein NUV53_02320 [Patescibacteria group bacterium]|nr:hypothetical protein [Patescibacteria group bacterium]